MKLTIAAIVSTLSVFCATATAQQIELLPEGQTLVTLSVTERVKVAQDTLVASLRIEGENRDAQALQDFINSAMTDALELAEDSDELEVSSGRYSVYQHIPQPQGGRRDPIWRGSQTIVLEGRDSQRILDLTGEIQEMGFVMNQLSYRLSTERADEVRDSLMENAIARAQEKAEQAAAALGKAEVDIAILNVDESLNVEPMMMRATATAEMASPVAESGETEVSLTVSVQAVAR